MPLTNEQKATLTAVANKMTMGWSSLEGGKVQAKRYRKALFKLNKDGWDGSIKFMAHPGIVLKTKEQILMDRWREQFHPKFPGRVSLAIDDVIHDNNDRSVIHG